MRKHIFTLLIISTSLCFGTTRYVSTTGSNEEPYLSWSTAGTDLQEVIDYCTDNDTIVIGKGTYYGPYANNIPLTILGTDRDSTILTYSDTTSHYTAIFAPDESLTIKNLTFKSDKKDYWGIYTEFYTGEGQLLEVEGCNFIELASAIDAVFFDVKIKGNLFKNELYGNYDVIKLDNMYPSYNVGEITDNLFITRDDAIMNGIDSVKILNNIIISAAENGGRIVCLWPRDYVEIRNNLIQCVAGDAISVSEVDTVIISNNTIVPYTYYGNYLHSGFINVGNIRDAEIYNNILYHVRDGVWIGKNSEKPAEVYNNLFYELRGFLFEGPINATDNLVEVDPMFVNDNFYSQEFWDVHLQKGSPAIDSGAPDVYDVDGTRSDMGVFGGPGGISYTYEDLPPKPITPDTAVYDSTTGRLSVKWYPNGESDLWGYRIYGDTTETFTPGESTYIGETTDTLYVHEYGEAESKYYYLRVQAKDVTGHEGISDSMYVVDMEDTTVTGVKETKNVYEYRLLGNYPNPFNPETKIVYELKEESRVRIKVYDMKGEEVGVIRDGMAERGYHEDTFSGEGLASGIYMYRMEVMNGNNVPVYLDTGKMILLK